MLVRGQADTLRNWRPGRKAKAERTSVSVNEVQEMLSDRKVVRQVARPGAESHVLSEEARSESTDKSCRDGTVIVLNTFEEALLFV